MDGIGKVHLDDGRDIFMFWQSIEFTVSASNAEPVSECLIEAGAISITFKDAGDNPIYEPELNNSPLWQQTKIIGLFEENMNLANVQILLQQTFPNLKFDFQIGQVEDQDWVRLTQSQFKPMCFGKRLWIYPSWHDAPQSKITPVILDPGLAFGTGTHPTTSLCLKWLDAHCEADWNVIDYGCGSGILGIAALALGAKQVWAIDNDPQALEATRENARRNHLTELQLITAMPNNTPPWQADCLLANILAKPLIELAPILAKLIKPRKNIILSGILIDQIPAIISAYEPFFTLQTPEIQEEWAMLAGKKHTDL